MIGPVAFDVPVEVAFDYLVEPGNRPRWQSSLRRVEHVQGEVRSGQTWVDVTGPGVRAAMETTALDRPFSWAERGVWRGIEATLTLRFRPTGEGCETTAQVRVIGRGLARPLGPVLTRAAALAVPRDLRRAARILSEHSAGH
jgi:uncharacterized protein YndB with AHSA1/START domain